MKDRITQLNSGDDSLPVRALRRIRQWIEEHFVSISEAARTIELSKYKLGRILRGQTKITLEILEDLCQRLGVAVEYFVSVDETSGAEIAPPVQKPHHDDADSAPPQTVPPSAQQIQQPVQHAETIAPGAKIAPPVQEPPHGGAVTPARAAETAPAIILAKAENELDPNLTKLIAVIESGGRIPQDCDLFLEDYATWWDIGVPTFRDYLKEPGVRVGSVGKKTLITASDLLTAIPRKPLPVPKQKEAGDG